jgi:enoyl-CoA hydratase/carnithine racemase
VSEDILSAVEGSIGIVTLNRPQSHNAITREMWKSLPAVFEQLKKKGAKAIVLEGQGGSFASGADLSQLTELKDHDSAADFWISIENCLHAIWQFELPVIAMIQGPCFGGGCLLATACDMRIVAKDSTFGIPSAHLGIVLDDASIARLVALVGVSFARRMLYTSATIYTEEAEKHGLIDKVFEAGALRGEVMRIAATMEHNDARAIAEAKRSINRLQMALYNAPCSINSDEQRQMIVERYQSPEFHQRVAKAIESLQ